MSALDTGGVGRLGGLGSRLYRGDVSVDFVGRKKLWYSISGLILVISVVALALLRLNFSVDFKGGSVFQFPATSSEQISQVRSTISAAGGGQDAYIQQITPIGGGSAKWQVQTHPLTQADQASIEKAISSTFHVPGNAISASFVGPSWGSQISQKAALALIVFLVVIVIYLTIAFEWKMATAAIVALAHDIVITVGVYALARFQVSPATVIGLLTILGYSLYDTVVVFDKVRENTAGLLGSSRVTYSQAANQALNQTLVRSINTSIIALLPVAAILFIGAGLLGAGELKDLALVLFVGMLSGTYSSICIATPVLADLKEREPQYKALAKRVALRSAGGRAAKRAEAKATAGGDDVGRAARGRGGLALAQPSDAAGAGSLPDDDIADDQLAGDDAGPAEGPAEPGPRSGEPVAAGRAAPRQGAPRPAPRQQPRRPSSAKRRPSGKKKRR